MPTLYIQRHGHAAAPSGGGERLLTCEGQRLLRVAAAALQAGGLRLSAVVYSPLLRTRQTAELMRPCLKPGAEEVACSCLAPGSDAETFAAWLASRLPTMPAILVVAHMPEVALWTELWAAPPHKTSLLFAPGSMARLDLPGAYRGPLVPAVADLRWLQPVEALGGQPPDGGVP